MDSQDRLLGCVVGGAIGDAIGLYTEFFPRSHALELYGPSPSFSLVVPPPAGETGIYHDQHRSAFLLSGWTDDTDQSLLILLGFLASGAKEVDPFDFAKRLKFWVANGLRCLDRLPLGLGRTVGSVVRDKTFEYDPFGTSIRYWENTNRFVAANGAVMRTAIIGALLFQDVDGVNGVDRAMHASLLVGATTHPDPRQVQLLFYTCLASCTIVTALVAAMMRNELVTLSDFDAVVQRGIEYIQSPPSTLPFPFVPLTESQIEEIRAHVYAEKLEDLQLDDRQKIGYTLKCLGAGIWALRQAMKAETKLGRDDLFEQCITEITMQGGDADTNATVAGSLLGTYLGLSCIPEKWKDNLRDVDWLIAKTRSLGYLLDPSGTYPVYDWKDDKDVLIDGGKGAFTKEELKKRYDELMCDVAKRVYDAGKEKENKEKDKEGLLSIYAL
ncbi:ADP-ribosylglycohydrolase [Ceratobasidium sp. AG-Ba]|nr:ADP-ribosylglycohydrolase [Ceratobasidium sp. AG-Ba]